MNKRILILDDDQSILDVLQEVFNYEGFETITIGETDDLCHLLGMYRPELVLLDYALSGENGGILCEQIKSHPEYAHIPVVIYTAYSNKGISKGSFGCDDFIAKPFDLYDLITRINNLQSKQQHNENY